MYSYKMWNYRFEIYVKLYLSLAENGKDTIIHPKDKTHESAGNKYWLNNL